MVDIDYTFMDTRQEYKVIYKNIGKNRISIIPIGDDSRLPEIGEIIKINNDIYKVSYIHAGKKRITLDLVRKGETENAGKSGRDD